MSFFSDLLEKPANLSTESKYAVMNGYIYLAIGATLIVWPGAVQTIFMDRPFVGHESALFRVIGMRWPSLAGFTYSAVVPALANSARLPYSIGWCSSWSARTPRDSGRFSSYVGGVCDSRPYTRHRCLGDPQSQDVT